MAYSHSVRGLLLAEHEITVPLDHSQPRGETLTVFAREVALAGGEKRPYLLFLQGGPGGESPRPTSGNPPWMMRLLKDYRVLFLDQRGTGRSTPVGSLPGMSPQQQYEYLTHFRADAIVEDAEMLRKHLGVDTWALLGQSFGGFCSLRYLSTHADSLSAVYFTGGVPAVGVPLDEVYAGTYAQMMRLSREHYRRFGEDADRMRRLVEMCDAGDITLPGGRPLSSRRLRTLGSALGMTPGSEALHYLLERDPASPGFRYGVANMLPFGGSSPLYTLVHEACWADGEATRWSAQRVHPAEYDDDVTLLTGEHPFPWHLEEDPELEPLAECAELLAQHEWPRLYDEDALRSVDVPCAAAIYVDDPFVLMDYSRKTLDLIPGARTFISNEWLHDGIRAGGDKVVDRLIALARNEA